MGCIDIQPDDIFEREGQRLEKISLAATDIDHAAAPARRYMGKDIGVRQVGLFHAPELKSLFVAVGQHALEACGIAACFGKFVAEF
jgi:hypothetical protein